MGTNTVVLPVPQKCHKGMTPTAVHIQLRLDGSEIYEAVCEPFQPSLFTDADGTPMDSEICSLMPPFTEMLDTQLRAAIVNNI